MILKHGNVGGPLTASFAHARTVINNLGARWTIKEVIACDTMEN
jgi:hypothetical protein